MNVSEGNTTIINNQIRMMILSGNKVTIRYFNVGDTEVQHFDTEDNAKEFYSGVQSILKNQGVDNISTGWTKP